MAKAPNDVTGRNVFESAQRIMSEGTGQARAIPDAVMVESVKQPNIEPSPSNHELLTRALDLLQSIDRRLANIEKQG
ncbi:hypothetical protein SAMN05216374_2670 [Tardiphaga sp. OK246]|jgi:uncharacterized protein|uniref:hypothetical protein n=1 Tax=Tardiphaga sp. OK246 TaxID=1855307 RepID=UPI000B6E58DC|nr:hypothetical protein [Tardiphaga sp. OK246]SNT09808.1 hypothetical protein SAMN05216374_2670 [Tardiphaga sp. OK246]